MPDVSRSDSQRSDSSQRPRVSFNRDVHIKRIGRTGGSVVTALNADGEGHLVTTPVRRERGQSSRSELAKEAALVLKQADQVKSVPAGSPDYSSLSYNSLDRRKLKNRTPSLRHLFDKDVTDNDGSTAGTQRHADDAALSAERPSRRLLGRSVSDVGRKPSPSKAGGDRKHLAPPSAGSVRGGRHRGSYEDDYYVTDEEEEEGKRPQGRRALSKQDEKKISIFATLDRLRGKGRKKNNNSPTTTTTTTTTNNNINEKKNNTAVEKQQKDAPSTLRSKKKKQLSPIIEDEHAANSRGTPFHFTPDGGGKRDYVDGPKITVEPPTPLPYDDRNNKNNVLKTASTHRRRNDDDDDATYRRYDDEISRDGEEYLRRQRKYVDGTDGVVVDDDINKYGGGGGVGGGDGGGRKSVEALVKELSKRQQQQRRLARTDRSPDGVAADVGATDPERSHNDNRPFSYTEPNDDQVIYAEVVCTPYAAAAAPTDSGVGGPLAGAGGEVGEEARRGEGTSAGHRATTTTTTSTTTTAKSSSAVQEQSDSNHRGEKQQPPKHKKTTVHTVVRPRSVNAPQQAREEAAIYQELVRPDSGVDPSTLRNGHRSPPAMVRHATSTDRLLDDLNGLSLRRDRLESRIDLHKRRFLQSRTSATAYDRGGRYDCDYDEGDDLSLAKKTSIKEDRYFERHIRRTAGSFSHKDTLSDDAPSPRMIDDGDAAYRRTQKSASPNNASPSADNDDYRQHRHYGDAASTRRLNERNNKISGSPHNEDVPPNTNGTSSTATKKVSSIEKVRRKLASWNRKATGVGKKGAKGPADRTETEDDEDAVRTRYREYRGGGESALLIEESSAEDAAGEHSKDREYYATRQRMSTPKPENEKSDSTWFKSLTRRNKQKDKKSTTNPRIDPEDTVDYRLGRNTANQKNLRFFGESNRGSNPSINTSHLQVPSQRNASRLRSSLDSSAESTLEDDSGHSQKSVIYLHAATVGDIPGSRKLHRSQISAGHRSLSREELSTNGGSTIVPHTRTLSRSISVLAPWRPRHPRDGIEVNYNDAGKPPRAPKTTSKTPTKPEKKKQKENRKQERRNSDESRKTSSSFYDTDDQRRRIKSTNSINTTGSTVDARSRRMKKTNSETDISRSGSMSHDNKLSSGWFRNN